MTRRLTFAALLGTLSIGGMLQAQTPARMALPTGGLNPPQLSSPQLNSAQLSAPQPAKSSVQPVSGTPAKTATTTPAAPMMLPQIMSEASASKSSPVSSTAAPAKPVLIAAQPTIAGTPAANPAPTAGSPAVFPLNGPLTAATPTVAPAVSAQVSAAAPSPATTSSNPFDLAPAKATTAPAEQPEWRYAQKPDLTNQPRPTRTALMQPEQRSPNRIRDCLLKASAEVQLPAQEAGVLVELQTFEGQEVKQHQIVGRVDDAQPRLQKKAAEAERNVSIEKGKSTISEQYALKASEVARKEWEKAVESNNRAPGSVSEVEVMRLKLTWEKGMLERERAQEERKIENLTVQAKDVDVEAADDAIRRRHLIAPIAGTVVELTPHVGEWLKPGDPVLKIVNMEVLKIEGYVNISNHLQEELRNQLVKAEVDLGKQKVAVDARITFVSPIVEPGGEYRIKAEIQNRKNTANEWELKPGLNAELILKAGAPGLAPRLP